MQLEERPPTEKVDERRSQLAQRLHGALAALEVAGPAGADGHHVTPVQLGREERERRCLAELQDRRQLVRGSGGDLSIAAKHLEPVLERVVDVSRQHRGADGVQAELELGDDPEVAAPAA